MEIHISDIGQIRNAAHQFIEYLGDKRIFSFHGGMGAGKTTFIKGKPLSSKPSAKNLA